MFPDLQGISPNVIWLAILLQVTIGVVVIVRYITDINKKRQNAEQEKEVREDAKETLRIEQEGRREEVYAELMRGLIAGNEANRVTSENGTKAVVSAVEALKAMHGDMTNGFNAATDDRRKHVTTLTEQLDGNRDEVIEAITSFNGVLEGRFDKIDPALLGLVNDVSHLASIVQEAKGIVTSVQTSVQESLSKQEAKFNAMIGEHSALRADVHQLTESISVLDSATGQFRELAGNVILKLSDFAQQQATKPAEDDNLLPDAA